MITVTEVYLGTRVTALAVPKARQALQPLHLQEPHINGGESGLDGSVPDLRTGISVSIYYIQAKELCYLVNVKMKQIQR